MGVFTPGITLSWTANSATRHDLRCKQHFFGLKAAVKSTHSSRARLTEIGSDWFRSDMNKRCCETDLRPSGEFLAKLRKSHGPNESWHCKNETRNDCHWPCLYVLSIARISYTLVHLPLVCGLDGEKLKRLPSRLRGMLWLGAKPTAVPSTSLPYWTLNLLEDALCQNSASISFSPGSFTSPKISLNLFLPILRYSSIVYGRAPCKM